MLSNISSKEQHISQLRLETLKSGSSHLQFSPLNRNVFFPADFFHGGSSFEFQAFLHCFDIKRYSARVFSARGPKGTTKNWIWTPP